MNGGRADSEKLKRKDKFCMAQQFKFTVCLQTRQRGGEAEAKTETEKKVPL